MTLPKIRQTPTVTPPHKAAKVTFTSKLNLAGKDAVPESRLKLPPVPPSVAGSPGTFLTQEQLLQADKKPSAREKQLPRKLQLIKQYEALSLDNRVALPDRWTEPRPKQLLHRPVLPSLESLRASRALARRERVPGLGLLSACPGGERQLSMGRLYYGRSSRLRRFRPRYTFPGTDQSQRSATLESHEMGMDPDHFIPRPASLGMHRKSTGLPQESGGSTARSLLSGVGRTLPREAVFLNLLREAHRERQEQIRRKWHTIVTCIILAGRVAKHIAGLAYELVCDIIPTMKDSVEAITKDPATPGSSFLERKSKSRRAEVVLSYHIQMILDIPPEERKQEQIEAVLAALQRIPSFCTYSIIIQRKIARHASYLRVGSNRVIVRQGFFPENWYFVVNGQALAAVIDADSNGRGEDLTTLAHSSIHRAKFSGRVSTVFSRGMSFGEMAILSETPHRQTVTSRRPMQMILIRKDVFKDVFRSVSMEGDRSIPDHIRYVRELAFLRNWPTQNLMTQKGQCFQHYVRNSKVLVQDSTDNEWIYIVRTGECAVYMYVEGIQASWRDLELCLAHPTVNIDGWPEPLTDVGQVRPAGRKPAYMLYNRLSCPDLVRRDMARQDPHLMLGPPYCNQREADAPPARPQTTRFRDAWNRRPGHGDHDPSRPQADHTDSVIQRRTTVLQYLPSGTRIHRTAYRRSRPTDVKHPHQKVAVRIPPSVTERQTLKQATWRADAKEASLQKKHAKPLPRAQHEEARRPVTRVLSAGPSGRRPMLVFPALGLFPRPLFEQRTSVKEASRKTSWAKAGDICDIKEEDSQGLGDGPETDTVEEEVEGGPEPEKTDAEDRGAGHDEGELSTEVQEASHAWQGPSPGGGERSTEVQEASHEWQGVSPGEGELSTEVQEVSHEWEGEQAGSDGNQDNEEMEKADLGGENINQEPEETNAEKDILEMQAIYTDEPNSDDAEEIYIEEEDDEEDTYFEDLNNSQNSDVRTDHAWDQDTDIDGQESDTEDGYVQETEERNSEDKNNTQTEETGTEGPCSQETNYSEDGNIEETLETCDACRNYKVPGKTHSREDGVMEEEAAGTGRERNTDSLGQDRPVGEEAGVCSREAKGKGCVGAEDKRAFEEEKEDVYSADEGKDKAGTDDGNGMTAADEWTTDAAEEIVDAGRDSADTGERSCDPGEGDAVGGEWSVHTDTGEGSTGRKADAGGGRASSGKGTTDLDDGHADPGDGSRTRTTRRESRSESTVGVGGARTASGDGDEDGDINASAWDVDLSASDGALQKSACSTYSVVSCLGQRTGSSTSRTRWSGETQTQPIIKVSSCVEVAEGKPVKMVGTPKPSVIRMQSKVRKKGPGSVSQTTVPPGAAKASSLSVRKKYKVPDKCLPPKPAAVKRTDPYTCYNPPVCVEIATLSEGDVFGLDQLSNHRKGLRYYNKSQKVSLVSRGAEVILMRKRFYAAYMTDKTEEDIRCLAPCYPSPKSVQDRLKLQLAWKMWCRKVSDEMHQDLDNRKQKMHGLYFRRPGVSEWQEVLHDLNYRGTLF